MIVNYDKSYDFSKIKTFAVQVGSPAQDPFLEKHFVSTVNSPPGIQEVGADPGALAAPGRARLRRFEREDGTR